MAGMEPRPFVSAGKYFRTKPYPARTVCKGYTEPPTFGGHYIQTLPQGTYIGPVSRHLQVTDFFQDVYLSVEIGGWWINVWKQNHTDRGPCTDGLPRSVTDRHATPLGHRFAIPVPQWEVDSWVSQGWIDGYNPSADTSTASSASSAVLPAGTV